MYANHCFFKQNKKKNELHLCNSLIIFKVAGAGIEPATS